MEPFRMGISARGNEAGPPPVSEEAGAPCSQSRVDAIFAQLRAAHGRDNQPARGSDRR